MYMLHTDSRTAKKPRIQCCQVTSASALSFYFTQTLFNRQLLFLLLSLYLVKPESASWSFAEISLWMNSRGNMFLIPSHPSHDPCQAFCCSVLSFHNNICRKTDKRDISWQQSSPQCSPFTIQSCCLITLSASIIFIILTYSIMKYFRCWFIWITCWWRLDVPAQQTFHLLIHWMLQHWTVAMRGGPGVVLDHLFAELHI